MKLFITLLFCVIGAVSGYSQLYFDGVPLNDVFKGKYVNVCAKCPRFNTVFAQVDFGQAKPDNIFERNVHYLSDINGKRIRFNSPIGIMNLMFENGFKVFHVSDSTNCIMYDRIE